MTHHYCPSPHHHVYYYTCEPAKVLVFFFYISFRSFCASPHTQSDTAKYIELRTKCCLRSHNLTWVVFPDYLQWQKLLQIYLTFPRLCRQESFENSLFGKCQKDESYPGTLNMVAGSGKCRSRLFKYQAEVTRQQLCLVFKEYLRQGSLSVFVRHHRVIQNLIYYIYYTHILIGTVVEKIKRWEQEDRVRSNFRYQNSEAQAVEQGNKCRVREWEPASLCKCEEIKTVKVFMPTRRSREEGKKLNNDLPSQDFCSKHPRPRQM